VRVREEYAVRMRSSTWTALALLVLSACLGARATRSTRYQGIILNARNLGAGELRREAADDPTLRDYVARAGQPDYIYVAGPTDVELVYARESRLVHFHRDRPHGPSRVGELTPLPEQVTTVLPLDIRAGTPGPLTEFRVVNCWRVSTAEESCRTCCRSSEACSTDCAAGAPAASRSSVDAPDGH